MAYPNIVIAPVCQDRRWIKETEKKLIRTTAWRLLMTHDDGHMVCRFLTYVSMFLRLKIYKVLDGPYKLILTSVG
jgi:hypothetical protein